MSYPLTDAYAHYDHVLLPISFALNMNLGKKISFHPEFGTRIALLTDKDKTPENSNIRSTLLSMKISVERKLTDRLSLAVTPAYYSMITPVYYNNYIGSHNNRLYSHNKLLMLQAGIVMHLSHHAKAQKTQQQQELKK